MGESVKKAMKYKEWIISDYDNAQVNSLMHSLNISPIMSKLLIHRSLSDTNEARAFLKKDFTAFYSPFLMKDVEKGANLIIDAIKNKEKILIWGDYDVDGVTSVTVLLKYLSSIGGKCDYYIPKRSDDGYGLNSKVIGEYANKGTGMLITVDSGITAINEVSAAKNLGMRVIVTDHHECRAQLPCADAVINPKRSDCSYPFKELAGVGVVFKLICAVEILRTGKSNYEISKKLAEIYSDFVAIGTIADVMPITSENRVIVNCGLIALENTPNIGLSALIEEAGINTPSSKKRKISSTTVGFVLAPRINAAGRMDTSKIAVDLFMTESHEEAASLAARLTFINKERQIAENDILQSALEKINTQCDLKNDRVIILDDDNWHHGIIGIVSSRITEKYNLPSVLISFKDEGMKGIHDIGKGSGRSVKGMNLVKALAGCSEILTKFGGHELAAGLSVKRENLSEFKKRLNDYAKNNLDDSALIKNLEIDCEISMFDASLKLANELSCLEPFGLSNPVPLFCTTDVKIISIASIGNGKHTKLCVEKDSCRHTALLFGTPTASFQFFEGDCVDIAYNLDVNNFKAQQVIQLIIRDIRPSKRERDIVRQHLHKYRKMLTDDSYVVNLFDIPTRADFAQIYSTVKNTLFANTDANSLEISVPFLVKLSNRKFNYDLPIYKAFIILSVLKEAHLLDIENEDELYLTVRRHTDNAPSQKIDLEETPIIKTLINKAGNTTERDTFI